MEMEIHSWFLKRKTIYSNAQLCICIEQLILIKSVNEEDEQKPEVLCWQRTHPLHSRLVSMGHYQLALARARMFQNGLK
jgi:hypothetical protein